MNAITRARTRHVGDNLDRSDYACRRGKMIQLFERLRVHHPRRWKCGCVGAFPDRSAAVEGALVTIGTLECQGWVKPTRTENARCLLQMHYRLQARYDAPEASTLNQRTRV